MEYFGAVFSMLLPLMQKKVATYGACVTPAYFVTNM